MTLQFSQHPGSRERQLQRQYNNPLFPESERDITHEYLKQVQDEELAALKVFSEEFRELLASASQLSGQVDSEVILMLKENSDRLYEQAATLPGNNEEVQQALRRLTDVVMQAVRAGAGNDPKALSELQQETEARAMHVELMKVPLVVDMLNPESMITPGNLAATVLSATNDEIVAALQLFEVEQIEQLYKNADALLGECNRQGHDVSAADEKLELIAAELEKLAG